MALRRRYAGHGITSHPPGRYFDQLSDLYAGKLWMVVDVSSSMAGGRLTEAVTGARDLLGQAISESYLAGVISFTESARLELDLTINLQHVDKALGRLRAGGGTDMSYGIRLAHEVLMKRRGERVMAIFSDGETDRNSAVAAAVAARRDGIRIIATLGGAADPGLMREVTGEDEELDVVPDWEVRERIAGMATLLRATWKT